MVFQIVVYHVIFPIISNILIRKMQTILEENRFQPAVHNYIVLQLQIIHFVMYIRLDWRYMYHNVEGYFEFLIIL